MEHKTLQKALFYTFQSRSHISYIHKLCYDKTE